MHRSFFAVKDTTINSGSDLIDGTTFQDKNVGQDEILELKKVYDNKEFKFPIRGEKTMSPICLNKIASFKVCGSFLTFLLGD